MITTYSKGTLIAVTSNLFKHLLVLICISLFLSLSVSNNTYAVEVENLYRGKILVTDKTQQTRVKAHRWAIEQVIAKVSGSRDVLNDPKIKRVVQSQTENYIKSFAFITDEQGRTFLVDEFDQIKIDRLLKSVGSSIWGQRRPNTVMWLVVEEGIQRAIIDENQFPQLFEFISQASDNRGLPIVLPTLDKTDREAVFTSDVWARFNRIVWQGSRRYRADNVVMARMRYVFADKEPEYNTGWLLEFELIDGERSLLKGEFNGEQFSVVRDMVNQVGDYFAAEYSIESESIESEEIYLTLNNIADVVVLHKAETLLRSMATVSDVFIQSIVDEKATFYLEMSGEGLDLVRAMALLPQFEHVQMAKEKQKKLTVEQQLEQLTRDYIQQVEQTNEKAETNQAVDTNVDLLQVDADKPTGKKRVNLFYNWKGS